ncbi:MAG: helix-turn-helix domain-containing protein [Acidimicrobiia bacterium]|nr:helix-turn-helix domain-containing protein [Acidimicrobiia bacterium]
MTLLTTKEVQDLFKVDKSTIYRMAEDGRIPAVKVGRQWRFPADQLDNLLGGAVPTGVTPPPSAAPAGELALEAVLPAETAQMVADLAAELFDVMAVVTDMEGNSLSTVANPCGYFSAVFEGTYTADRCADSWRQLGQEIDLEPRFLPSHLGFLCARSFIRHGHRLVGMLIVGGVAPTNWPPDHAAVAAVALETGVNEETIQAHMDEVYWIDEPHQRWIVRNLSRMSDLLSQLAEGRARLVTKLERIAALAGADPQTNIKETT